jgi:hypothetical protein
VLRLLIHLSRFPFFIILLFNQSFWSSYPPSYLFPVRMQNLVILSSVCFCYSVCFICIFSYFLRPFMFNCSSISVFLCILATYQTFLVIFILLLSLYFYAYFRHVFHFSFSTPVPLFPLLPSSHSLSEVLACCNFSLPSTLRYQGSPNNGRQAECCP